jgi:hypothetical protein
MATKPVRDERHSRQTRERWCLFTVVVVVLSFLLGKTPEVEYQVTTPPSFQDPENPLAG